jgi:hypothetical protein
MIRAWLNDLDVYGMSEPGNNEPQVEDICTVCDNRVIDHPGHERFKNERYAIGDGTARWPHRRAVIYGLLTGTLP